MNKFGELLRNVCTRTAMYVGILDYWRAVCWLDGYACGRSDAGDKVAVQGIRDFRTFLIKKYGRGSNRYWYHIIDVVTYGKTDVEKLAVLLNDFEEFTNVLTRMAIETKEQ